MSPTSPSPPPEGRLPVPKGLPGGDVEGGVLPDLQDPALAVVVAKGNIAEVLGVQSDFVQQVHLICVGGEERDAQEAEKPPLQGSALFVFQKKNINWTTDKTHKRRV